MMVLCRLILISIIAFTFFSTHGYGQSKLPHTELDALRKIATTLGKRDWNFSVDPCTDPSWNESTSGSDYENRVICSCINGTCHVTQIILKGQNLPGKLPPELTNLSSLFQIDLTRNYLSGSIPIEWGSMQLKNISLLGNRISGPIPKEIGNISTLQDLVLESNNLSGAIPPELGNLNKIDRILVTSNSLTGEIPSTFANLTTLTDFRISDNNFSGQIPEFIGKWSNLHKLVIQASGLRGPIPTNISTLGNLVDLRISDLDGPTSNFPTLNARMMKTLILRNCNISGQIPDYLGQLSQLTTLDISFNRLTGNLPTNIGNVKNYLFLTGNLLNGQIPQLKAIDNLDLSYTNITEGDTCQNNRINLFGSYSMLNNISRNGVAPCLKRVNCHKTNRVYINCGGPSVTIDGKTYEDDTAQLTPSYFLAKPNGWAISNTGYFLDGNTNFNFPNENGKLPFDNPIYSTARISPLTLTYYTHCLINGEYTVKLHFSEIVFPDNNSYSSLGRRIFDVYIQGELKLKDFNIKLEAGGYRKELVKNFTVNITDQTLEIRLYWAGKGTIAIPNRGVYGPLISAISVESNFEVPTKSKTAAIVLGVVIPLIVILLIVGILWWKGCFNKKRTIDPELRGIDLQTGSFTLRQIKAATNDFDSEYKIGEGGFGPVYKGLLSDGTIIAVKQLSSKSKQGNREFINEIGMISALHHPNLVKLYGCCIEESQLLVVYEYMENNSLARALFGPEEQQIKLDWSTRQKICVGIARGLAYLHEESRLKIVHRDIKATNVLLDKDLNPKISDFGLAKLDDEENTHISTRVAGTIGYMAPEYALRGYLTDKADVFSFGIVALEIVCGKSNSNFRPKEDCVYLLDYAYMLKQRDALMELVDSRLGSDFNKEEAFKMINIALLCAQPAPSDRPAMSSVVSMLEGHAPVVEPFSDPNSSREEAKFKAMRNQFRIMQNQDLSQTQTVSDGPWTGSSTSAADLYPINLDSEYLNKRE